MNEDKDPSLEYLVKDFIQSIQGSTTDWQERRLKEFLQSEISQSNKALLTKLRGEMAEGKMLNTKEESTSDWFYGYGNNQAKDQDIALIDKYLEHI